MRVRGTSLFIAKKTTRLKPPLSWNKFLNKKLILINLDWSRNNTSYFAITVYVQLFCAHPKFNIIDDSSALVTENELCSLRHYA